jgi:predicted DNA-binding transcriptional regulator AlpA
VAQARKQYFYCGESTYYDRLNPKSKRHDPDMPKPFKLGGIGRNFVYEDEAIAYQAAQIEKGIKAEAAGLVKKHKPPTARRQKHVTLTDLAGQQC